MPTYAFSIGSPLPFSWPSGKLLRARFFDAAAGTVTDLALVEVTPGEYAGTTQADSTSSSFTVVIRQVDTQDAAGFDAATATNRQAFADDYVPDASITTDGTGGVDGSEATPDDLDDWYGSENINPWSNQSGGTTRDTARVARALAYARDEVLAFFANGPYLLPFSYNDTASQSKVRKWQVVIATAWLVGKRWMSNSEANATTGPSATVNTDVTAVMDEMRKYLAAEEFRLNVAARNSTASPSVPVIVQGGSGGFCWHELA